MATGIPRLSVKEIERHFDDRSFKRGKEYFEDGAVFDLSRQGDTLHARCAGSGVRPYRVSAAFARGKLQGTACSCPVGVACKHAAALLLAWHDDPEAFTEVEPLETALAGRSRDELAAIVREMIKREPELEVLVHRKRTAAGRLNATAIRRQAKTSVSSPEDTSVDPVLIRHRLDADEALAAGKPGRATQIYAALLQGIAEGYEPAWDYEGEDERATFVSELVEALERCLASGKRDSADRALALRALFDAHLADMEQGGIEFASGAAEALRKHARGAERKEVAGWARAAAHDSSDRTWARQELGRLALDLEGDDLDDEAFLATCRATGRTVDLVDRLLSLKRLDEALTEARRRDDYGLLELAGVFGKHHHPKEIEQVIAERAEHGRELRLHDWLERRALERGDLAAALDWRLKAFALYPSLAGYQSVRELAKELKRWPALRAELMSALPASGEARVCIHLDEGELDDALAALSRSHASDSVRLQVARAAEGKRPEAALRIYRKGVESHIGLASRDSYAEAARLLKRMHDLFDRAEPEGAFEAYVRGLRAKYRSRRALQQEFDRMRLP